MSGWPLPARSTPGLVREGMTRARSVRPGTVADMLWVEYTTRFVARDAAEADTLLDALFAADEAVVCPGPDAPWEPCDHCHGTLVNPPDLENPDARSDDASWAPGAPCGRCTDGERPGWVQPCVREHTAGASMRSLSQVLDGEDTRTRELLRHLMTLLDADPAAARAFVIERLDELDAFERELLHAAARNAEATPSQ